MKVLHVIAGMNPKLGGVCQALLMIANGLHTKGIANEILTLDDPGADFLKNIPFTVHAIGKSKGPWQFNSKLTPWLRKNLFQFDIVVCHGIWLFHEYAIRREISRLKKRKFTTPKFFIYPHGMLDPYFQKERGRKLKAIRNEVYWKLIENKNINEADAIIFTCQKERELAGKTFQSYRPKKEIIIGLGINEPPQFCNEMRTKLFEKCPGIKNSSFLLFLGRIHGKKGVDILIQAYQEIFFPASANKTDLEAKEIPKLVIAGPGLESSYGTMLQNKLRENSELQASVLFPGMLTGQAKWGAFYGCDAFVLPSHQENFGIAVAEALACSKPVLISDQVNIWPEIKDAGAGIIGEDSLYGVKEMLHSWKSFSLIAKNTLAIHAFKCYQNNFSIEHSAKRFITELNSVKTMNRAFVYETSVNSLDAIKKY
jgi:glycosyltransferase involved in cell wall biosynthesis